MTARAASRDREIAVRLAIGASRRRIVRQLLAESLLLASAGAAAGLLVAQWLSRFLLAMLATDDNRPFVDLSPDWRVCLFAAGLAAAACALFGLAPALNATGVNPGTAMRTSGRGVSETRTFARRALVVVQIALSLVLVAGAFLFVRTLRNLAWLDAGFRSEGIVVADLDLRKAAVPAEAMAAVQAQVLERLKARPEVTAAAQTFMVPITGRIWNERILIGGALQESYPNFNRVGRGFFDTLGTPFVKGRDFDARDTPTSPRLVIVNETFFRRYLSGRDPIGGAFQIEEPPGAPRPFFEVVGIVKDTKYEDLREPLGPIAYLAASQEPQPGPGLTIVLRSPASAAVVTAGVTRAIAEVNPNISIEFQSLSRQMRDSLVSERLMATVSGYFGALAGL